MPQLSGELRDRSVQWESRPRHFTAYVPQRLAAEPDLVFVLHGSGGSGAQMRTVSAYRFDELADATGAVIVYPDGYDNHWNDCRRAAPYAANRENVDDVGLLRLLTTALEKELSVRFANVFATGLSNGGHMALRLALEAPDWITAAAPIAANMPDDANFDCTKTARPTALLLMNGTDDPMNPYAGGEVAMFGILASRGMVLSSDDTAAYFAGLAGHAGEPATESLPDVDPGDGTRIVRRSWRGDGGPPVELVTIEGGGHTVPHAESRLPRILGRTSRDADAATLIWNFFDVAKATRGRAVSAAH